MKRFYMAIFLSLSMVGSPVQARWSKLDPAGVPAQDLIPIPSGSAARGVNWNSDLAVELRAQGFSDTAIAFALRVAQGGVEPANARQIADGVMDSAQSKVHRLATVGENLEAIKRLMKRRKIWDGSLQGGLAAVLLIFEGLYAYTKTEKNFETPTDAIATNFARVAVVAGATTLAAEGLTRKGFGAKLFGIKMGLMTLGAVGIGIFQITMDQKDYITAKNIEEASKRLESILAEEKQLKAERMQQRRALIQEKQGLVQDRATIFSVTIPESLTERRDELQAELTKLQRQLEAYDVDVKPGSSQADYAQQLRDEGFTHVGINMDGDASNDGLYRNQLLPKATADIARVEESLAPIITQINDLSLQGTAANLSPADQQRLAKANDRIEALSDQIARLAADSAAIRTLQKSYEETAQMLAFLRSQGVGANANLYDEFSQFVNTKEGLNAASAGIVFGMLSIVGGVVLHRAIHTIFNRGYVARGVHGSTMVNGLHLDDLLDRNYAIRMDLELNSQMRTLNTPNGVEFILRNAAQSELESFTQAVEAGSRSGHINPQARGAAAQVITATYDLLDDKFRHISDFATTISRMATASEASRVANDPIFRKAAKAALAAKKGRLGGNLPWIGGAIAVGATAATTFMLSSQAEAMEHLVAMGDVSPEVAQDYYDTVQTYGAAYLLGDVALSIVDPTPLTLPVTFIAESNAGRLTKNWADRNALIFDQAMMDMLSPGAFGNESLPNEFVGYLRRAVPQDTEGHDETLHQVIIANQAMREFYRRNPEPRMPSLMANASDDQARVEQNTERLRWRARLDSYKGTFMDAMTQLVSVPKNLQIYLSLYSIDDRLRIVERLGVGDRDLLSDSSGGRYELIADYIADQKSGGMLPHVFTTSPEGTLRANPGIITEYILSRMGVDMENI